MKQAHGWEVWLLLICAHATTAYYHGPSKKIITQTNLTADSYFGYSITYQTFTKRLFVGAPKANRVGQVYVVDIESSNVTATETPQILFDHIADIKAKTEANNQFLYGAMVKAGTNSIVTCAPKNAQLISSNKSQRTSVLGLCFKNPIEGKQRVLDNDRLYINIEKRGLFKPYGWSVDITRDNTVLVGSPAFYYGRLKVVQDTIQELHQSEVYYSFGYSVASGKYFDDDITSLYYAVSSPYGINGTGKVLFWNVKNINKYQEDRYTINDYNVGSLFGAALCTVNLGNRRDHLLVGAPTYTQGNVVDRGAVHLYFMEDGVFCLRKTVEGPSDATVYFGNSLANLGDMDGDMRDEVAVGAPYENEGRGAVYIYSGSGLGDPNKNGNQMLIQKVQPEPNDGIKSFGYSLTSVQDYDENGCNELAVGAPESNFVVVYNCFAYITIKLRPEFRTKIQSEQNKDEDKLIFQSCVDIEFHKSVKKINEKIRVQVKISHPDVWFWAASNGATKPKPINAMTYDELITVDKKIYCRDIDVAVRKDRSVTEDGSVMSYTITASLIDDARNIPQFDKHRVLLSPQSRLVFVGQESLDSCEGAACEPDLEIRFKSPMRNIYTVGSTSEGSFSFVISNKGATAYTPCLLVAIKGAPLLRLPQGCVTTNRENLICNPTTLLIRNSTWNTGNITLDTRQLTSKNEKIIVSYTLYSRCSNRSTVVDKDKESYLLISDTKGITIERKLDPGEIVDIYAEPSRVRHVYTITNSGPTTWKNVSISFVLTKIERVVTYENIIVEIDDERQAKCPISETETQEQLTAICNYVDLKKGKSVNVIVPFVASAYTDDNTVMAQNVTSSLHLHLKKKAKKSSATTQLFFKTSEVPLWIIITASLVALFILVLVVYALFSLGFLKRQKKMQLEKLKRNVYRQSMHRKSMRNSNRVESAQDALINDPMDIDRIEEILNNEVY